MLSKIYLLAFSLVFAFFQGRTQVPNWSVEQSNYTYTMSLVAAAQNECTPSSNANDQIGVFDEEGVCRGVASFISTSQGYRAFITIFSNKISEQLFYRIYDATEGKVFFAYLNKLDFLAESIQGSVSNPTTVFFDSDPQVDAGIDQMIENKDSTQLAASGSVGTWIIQYGEGGRFEDATNPNSKFYGQYGETYMLIWVVADNDCLNEMDHVMITFTDNTCPISRVFDNAVVVTEAITINASDSIISQANIENNASVDYRAGKQIILRAGFHAKAGSSFHAKIENCASGNSQIVENRAKNEKENRQSSLQLELSPNPAKDYIQIEFISPINGDNIIEIFDANGRIIEMLKVNTIPNNRHKISLPLREYRSGLYYIRLRNGHQITSEKMMIAR